MSARAQANVVGAALLIGVTVVALGTLTAAIGGVVDGTAARADASRVAADLDAALAPVEATGYREGTVRFTEGDLYTVTREIRLLDDDGVVRRVETRALVFETDSHRVTFLGGALVRGTPPGSTMRTPPPVTESRAGDTLVVGVATLGGDVAVGGSGPVTLVTRVRHDRERVGSDTYRVAVETATPRPWRRYFEDEGHAVSMRDFDDDGTPSVVARYAGRREAYLVRHRLRLEVADD